MDSFPFKPVRPGDRTLSASDYNLRGRTLQQLVQSKGPNSTMLEAGFLQRPAPVGNLDQGFRIRVKASEAIAAYRFVQITAYDADDDYFTIRYPPIYPTTDTEGVFRRYGYSPDLFIVEEAIASGDWGYAYQGGLRQIEVYTAGSFNFGEHVIHIPPSGYGLGLNSQIDQ